MRQIILNADDFGRHARLCGGHWQINQLSIYAELSVHRDCLFHGGQYHADVLRDLF